MSIFMDIRQHITARQAAEYYGLKVSPKGMACCPFHEDKHPSMKIDTGFFCFGCGAMGSDATGYVAKVFGLSQIDAARKLISDLHLPIEAGYPDAESARAAREQWKRQERERQRSVREKLRFNRWCGERINELKKAMQLAERIQARFHEVGRVGEEIPREVADADVAASRMDYWLDVLCTGTNEDRQEFYRYFGEALTETLQKVRDAAAAYLPEGAVPEKSAIHVRAR